VQKGKTSNVEVEETMNIIKTTAYIAAHGPQPEQGDEMVVVKSAVIRFSSKKPPTAEPPIPPDEEMQDETQEGKMNWFRRNWYSSAARPSRNHVLP
jgi:hypothetical protein